MNIKVSTINTLAPSGCLRNVLRANIWILEHGTFFETSFTKYESRMYSFSARSLNKPLAFPTFSPLIRFIIKEFFRLCKIGGKVLLKTEVNIHRATKKASMIELS